MAEQTLQSLSEKEWQYCPESGHAAISGEGEIDAGNKQHNKSWLHTLATGLALVDAF